MSTENLKNERQIMFVFEFGYEQKIMVLFLIRFQSAFAISLPDLQLKFKVVSNGDSMHTYHIHVLQLLHSPLKARRVTSITPSNFNQAVAMLD